MKLFKKKGKSDKAAPSAFIQRFIDVLKANMHRLNTWLQQRTAGYSAKKKKVLLCIFCCISLSAGCFLIYSTFVTHKADWLVIKPITFNLPKQNTSMHLQISAKEFQRLASYKISLDSLKKVYADSRDTSIIKQIQGTQQQINLLQNLYYEQHGKNK